MVERVKAVNKLLQQRKYHSLILVMGHVLTPRQLLPGLSNLKRNYAKQKPNQDYVCRR